MRWPFALRAEILHGLHQASSKIHLPEAIHYHPRLSSLVDGIYKPFGEAQSVIGRAFGQCGQCIRNARLRTFPPGRS